MPLNEKISAAAILARLDGLTPIRMFFKPQNYIVYKPSKDLTRGVAAKFSYNVTPTFSEKGYVASVTGGCFAELVPQITSPNDFAKFDYEASITVKLGVRDLSVLLLGYRTVRERGHEVAVAYRPLVRTDTGFTPSTTGNAVCLIHKFDAVTSIILWSFNPEKGSIFEIRKGKDIRKSIALTLDEEVALVAYLQLALNALLVSGA